MPIFLLRRTRTSLPEALLATLAVLPIATWTPRASAVGLGEVISQSAIGQPLRIEIGLPGEQPERAAPECIRVIADKGKSADGIPSISSARIAIRHIGGMAVAVITDPSPANHPILRLHLQEVCDSNLKREYTLLLSDPPEITPAARTPEPLAAQTAPRATPSRKEAIRPSPAKGYKLWTARGGESLRSLAQRRHPGDEEAQARFIELTQKANPGEFGAAGASQGLRLKAGTQIYLPPNRTRTPKSTALRPSEPTQAAARPATNPADNPRATTPKGDQLVLQGQETGQQPPLKLARELGASDTSSLLSEDERDVMRREQKLQATVNNQIAMQADVAQRLRKLEALQAELRAQITAESAPAPGSATNAPTIAVESVKPTRPPKPESSSWPVALALLGGVAIAVGVWRQRRLPALPLPPAPPVPQPSAASEAAVPEVVQVAPPPLTPESVALAWDAFPPSSIEPHVPPALEDEEFLSEHDSAIELAEIMLSFGRVHGAAETLADFIRAHPNKSLAPWVKLLEVYRTADMQVEFEALSQRMNQTFNVTSIAWEDFDQSLRRASARLEDLPHLMEPISRLWGSSEGLAYMDKLLRDHREGTRRGFAIGVADDILMLISVLDYQLRLKEARTKRLAVI